ATGLITASLALIQLPALQALLAPVVYVLALVFLKKFLEISYIAAFGVAVIGCVAMTAAIAILVVGIIQPQKKPPPDAPVVAQQSIPAPPNPPPAPAPPQASFSPSEV